MTRCVLVRGGHCQAGCSVSPERAACCLGVRGACRARAVVCVVVCMCWRQDTLAEIIGVPKRANGNETSEKEARRIDRLRAQLNSLLREVRACCCRSVLLASVGSGRLVPLRATGPADRVCAGSRMLVRVTWLCCTAIAAQGHI